MTWRRTWWPKLRTGRLARPRARAIPFIGHAMKNISHGAKSVDEPTKLKTISKKTKKIAENVLFPGANNSYRKETSNA